MDITKSEARKSLDVIDEALVSMKRAIDRQSARIVLVWGVAYLVGPLCMHAWPKFGVIPLEVLVATAIAFTIYDTSRKSLVTGANSRKFGAVWGLIYAFGAIWMLILSPFNIDDIDHRFTIYSQQMWAYGVTLAMFIYVAMGFWMGKFYIVLGSLVTVCTLIGRFWLTDWFWLWCGVTGGGAMIVGGLYLRKRSQA
jgi:TRAP-type uncharacterized transport system fused permease subunit